jgi:hypothetical protein
MNPRFPRGRPVHFSAESSTGILFIRTDARAAPFRQRDVIATITAASKRWPR